MIPKSVMFVALNLPRQYIISNIYDLSGQWKQRGYWCKRFKT